MLKINGSAPRRSQPAYLLSPSCRGGAAFPRPGEPLLAPDQRGSAAMSGCVGFSAHIAHMPVPP